jgi:hypothetical protein
MRPGTEADSTLLCFFFVVARNEMNMLTINVQMTGKLARGQRPVDDGGAETRTLDPCSVTDPARAEAAPLFACQYLARTRIHRAYYTTHPRCRIRRFLPFFSLAATPETPLDFAPSRALVTDRRCTVKTLSAIRKKKGSEPNTLLKETAIFVFTKKRSTQNLLVFLSLRTFSPHNKPLEYKTCRATFASRAKKNRFTKKVQFFVLSHQ